MSRADRTVRAMRRRPATELTTAPAPLKREAVLRALEAMTPEDRLVLSLQLCDGLDDDETAEALGLPVRQVSRTRGWLLLGLRRALQGLPFGPRSAAAPAPLRSAA
jgi:DNA-directed RNA polymerase specialized sigma24 family protein